MPKSTLKDFLFFLTGVLARAAVLMAKVGQVFFLSFFLVTFFFAVLGLAASLAV